MSRRAADKAIRSGRVKINSIPAKLGDTAADGDLVILDGQELKPASTTITIMLNKPVGYVCSRRGQGSKTVYDLLPETYHKLKPIGRLDKDSSGLLLLTNDGELANELTHPKYQKEKVYRVKLNKTLLPEDKNKLLTGVELVDGVSKFIKLADCSNRTYEVVMAEGRKRQIRRTFIALGYEVIELHRTGFGKYVLGNLETGKISVVKDR